MSQLTCCALLEIAVKQETDCFCDGNDEFDVYDDELLDDALAIQQQQKQLISWQYCQRNPPTVSKHNEDGCELIMTAADSADFKPKVSRNGKRLLWQFLLHELLSGRSDLNWHPDQIRNPGVFAFKDPNSTARRWGLYKENENMSYEKMSRCIRDYYTRPQHRHFGVMQPDVQNYNTTNSGSSSSSIRNISGGCNNGRRRLHFAFNLRHPSVARFIRQFATGYYHKLVVMKLL